MEKDQAAPSPWWSSRVGDVGDGLPPPDYGLDLPKLRVSEFHYGHQLRLAREEAQLTQRELAEQVGWNRSNLARAEGNPRPSLASLDKLLKPMGLRTKVIFVPLEEE